MHDVLGGFICENKRNDINNIGVFISSINVCFFAD